MSHGGFYGYGKVTRQPWDCLVYQVFVSSVRGKEMLNICMFYQLQLNGTFLGYLICLVSLIWQLKYQAQTFLDLSC